MALADGAVGRSVTFTGPRWMWGVGALTVLTMLVTQVLLALEIRQLREAVVMWRRMAQLPAAGFGFPPLNANTLDGQTRLVGAGPIRSQVIAVFTTSCPYCRASQPLWRSLASRVDSLGNTDMVWLSLSPRDSTTAYVAEHQLPLDHVVLEADTALLLAARVRGVPLTMVVDSTGIIRYVHAGVVTSKQADSVILVTRASRGAAAVAPRPSSP